MSPKLEVRAPAPEERDALFAWLNTGLRNGSWRRLEQEFPNVLHGGLRGHVLALEGSEFAAHALAHLVDLRAGSHRVSVGMIGMVYTEPTKRNGGLASRCIEAAVEKIQRQGAGLCLLWSELDEFYQRLGFVRAGREWFFWLARGELSACVAASQPFDVAAPRASDWPAMERLYASHLSRVERSPGALRSFAASPECVVRVARRGSAVVAYAVRGRGDDFPDIAHEWAGEPAAVLACLGALCEGRDWLGLLCPPSATALLATLNSGGFRRFPNDLAWFRVVDAALVWGQLGRNAPALRALRLTGGRDAISCASAQGERQIDTSSFLAWILQGTEPAGLGEIVPAATRAAIRAALPVPLYLWGFDSV